MLPVSFSFTSLFYVRNFDFLGFLNLDTGLQNRGTCISLLIKVLATIFASISKAADTFLSDASKLSRFMHGFILDLDLDLTDL